MIDVNSYDVFDTLLARWYYYPKTIFEEVQRSSGFQMFYNLRVAAENTAKIKTLDEIYKTFSSFSFECAKYADELKKLETELEFEHTYPVRQMVDKVTENDIIVSDFYFDKKLLSFLLRTHGIEFRDLFVSYDGKSSGRVWSELKGKYNILRHYGDNRHSDIQMSSRFNIPSQEVHITKLTETEAELAEMGFGKVACLGRAVRLSNPYSVSNNIEKNLWDEEALYNIPILIILSQYLHNILVDGRANKLLLTQRDCCHLYPMHKKMYPIDRVYPFYTNRKLYNNPTDGFRDYVKRNYTQDSLIVDLQGTGDTCFKFFDSLGIKPNYLVLVDADREHKRRDTKKSLASFDTGISDKIERLNYDVNGRLKDVVWNSPVFEQPTSHVNLIKIQHDAVDCAMKFLDKGFRVDYEDSRVIKAINYLLKKLEDNPGINRVVPHEEI